MEQPLSYRALRRTMLAYSRADALINRVVRAARSAADGCVSTALTASEKADVNLRLFHDRREAYSEERSLHDWERPWFERRLPPAPARLLICAAGCGREATALAARGYAIDAFDFVPAMAERCAAALSDGHRSLTGSYEALSAAVIDGVASPLSPLAAGSYDAVVFGWGSLNNVLDPRERARAIRAACKLSPDGPVLTSFITNPPSAYFGARSRRAGVAAGSLLARARRIPATTDDLLFHSTLGFVKLYAPAEIERLADDVGRRVIWETESSFPHVTLVP